MERSEWKPELNEIKISVRLINLINKALIDCGQSSLTLNDTYDNWYPIVENNYAYTWITISETDTKKISGISVNVLQGFVWNKCNEGNNFEQIEYYYRCKTLYDKPTFDFRSEKGTYLKPGKIISWLFPSLDNDVQSCIASKLQTLLTNQSILDTSSIQLTNSTILPSDIYTMEHEDRNTLGASCMACKDKARFKLYDKNGWKLAYIVENNLLVARAFLHDHVQDTEGNTYKIMDRIYTSDCRHESTFKKYAKDNGYWHKREQRLNESCYITPDDSEIYLNNIFVECLQLEDLQLKEVPYVDTFAYYSPDEGKLFCQWLSNYNIETDLHNTDGNDSEGMIVNGRVCYHCDCRVSREDVYYQDGCNYCPDCYNELFVFCECCDSTVSINYSVYIESEGVTVCESCLRDNYQQCVFCNEWYSNNNTIYLSDTSNYCCQSCIDETHSCSECGEFFQREYNLTEDNGEYYCEDCLKPIIKEKERELIQEEMEDNDDCRNFKYEYDNSLSRKYDSFVRRYKEKYNKFPLWVLYFNYIFPEIEEVTI